MQTNTLYYSDSHQKTFSAKVLSCCPKDDCFAVRLDNTAFYPEGGGQPGDTGTLGTTRVTAVFEEGDAIIHLCNQALSIGETVTGQVDWTRRFDFMQQHTAEHILSGIIHRRYGYHNVGFHIGADVVTFDFDGIVPTEDLEKIEWEANTAIWQNLPVTCFIPSEEELPCVSYRAKKPLPWPVRIVEIPGFDSCACCGLHVKTTGELGLIKILSCIKFHQGVRLEMVCGSRALTYLSRIYKENRLVSQAFSAKLLETGAAAERMNELLAAEKYRSAGLEKQIFSYIAQSYAQQGDILHFEKDLSPSALRNLSEEIANHCGGIATVLTGSDEKGYNLCLCAKTADVRPLGNALVDAFCGRGGGKSYAFQGNLTATETEIRNYFREKR